MKNTKELIKKIIIEELDVDTQIKLNNLYADTINGEHIYYYSEITNEINKRYADYRPLDIVTRTRYYNEELDYHVIDNDDVVSLEDTQVINYINVDKLAEELEKDLHSIIDNLFTIISRIKEKNND